MEMEPVTKTCTKCKKEFTLSSFRKTPHTKKYKYGVNSVCLVCECAIGRAHYHKPEVRKKQLARGRLRIRNWDKERNASYLNRFGITAKDYDKMVVERNNLCDICGLPESRMGSDGRKTRLSIDHCHLTGNIRGLLCSRCNMAIGLFDDDADKLKKALKYIYKVTGLSY
jgi:hypothetical protein